MFSMRWREWECHTTENRTMSEQNETDVGDDLKITKTQRRKSAGGTWVSGTLNGHRFEALVFVDFLCAGLADFTFIE